MRIDTYQATGDVPDGRRFMAYIVVPGQKRGTEELLPVRFTGATEEGASGAAQAHWDEAMAKQAKPKPVRLGRPKKIADAPVTEVFPVSDDDRTQAQVASAILADGRDPRTGDPLPSPDDIEEGV